jgi:hypothetical protein
MYTSFYIFNIICACPCRKYFLQLSSVDRMVAEAERLVREYYGDNRTLCILTADHGMTDRGLWHSFYRVLSNCSFEFAYFTGRQFTEKCLQPTTEQRAI